MENESIFHLVDAANWAAAVAHGVYRPASLADEGFIYFSSRTQIVPVANRRFAGVAGLLLIELPDRRAAGVSGRLGG